MRLLGVSVSGVGARGSLYGLSASGRSDASARWEANAPRRPLRSQAAHPGVSPRAPPGLGLLELGQCHGPWLLDAGHAEEGVRVPTAEAGSREDHSGRAWVHRSADQARGPACRPGHSSLGPLVTEGGQDPLTAVPCSRWHKWPCDYADGLHGGVHRWGAQPWKPGQGRHEGAGTVNTRPGTPSPPRQRAARPLSPSLRRLPPARPGRMRPGPRLGSAEPGWFAGFRPAMGGPAVSQEGTARDERGCGRSPRSSSSSGSRPD